MCFGFWAGLMIYFNPFTFIDFAFTTSLLSWITWNLMKGREN